jgi:hydroxylaminobenzene mutase
MNGEETSRRLVWHGVLLFLLGLLTGIEISAFANPRMGLSAHLGGLMTGLFLMALGAVWRYARPGRTAAAVFWLALYGTYGSWLGLLLAAIFGTGRMTPIAGAGHGGTPWQENLVDAALVTSSIAIIACCVLFLRELRQRPE